MGVWASRAMSFCAALVLYGCGGNSIDANSRTDSGSNPGTQLGSNAGADNGSGMNPGGDTGGDPKPDDDTDTGHGTHDDTGSGGNPDCKAGASRCFDLAKIRVTRYKDDKKAAASYTFDDGYITSFRIADIFESLNLRATFYIIPGNVAEDAWAGWQDLAARGHEIGNHSMTHRNDMSADLPDAVLDTEIVESRHLLERKIGAGPMTFAFPWHAYTRHAFDIASRNHVAVRELEREGEPYEFAFFDQDHAADEDLALMQVNAQLDRMVQDGGWFVAGGHGLDGDGWSPVSSRFLRDHLAHAGTHAPKLWIDTFLNVTRYRICRAQARPEADVLSSSQLLVRLAGDFDTALCTQALTIALPTDNLSRNQLRVRDAAGSDLPVNLSDGALLLNLRPGDEAHVEIIRAQ